MLAIGDGTNDIEMLTMAREAGGCAFSHAFLFLLKKKPLLRSIFSYVCIACVNRENSVSVAMGNGNDRVKAAAEYVTGDHNDAGMGAALHRFVLTKATTKL